MTGEGDQLWVLGTPILDNFLTLVQNGDALPHLGMGGLLGFLVSGQAEGNSYGQENRCIGPVSRMVMPFPGLRHLPYSHSCHD